MAHSAPHRSNGSNPGDTGEPGLPAGMSRGATGSSPDGPPPVAEAGVRDEAEPDNIIGHATGWLAATRERARAVGHLAVAEARLAATSVAVMAGLGVLAAVCLLAAWGLLVAGVVYGLVQAGLALWLALLAMGGLHILAAWLLWRTATKLTRHLQFAETRARIRPAPEGGA
ncbi:MAG TPA: phage holin family protein [Woeseiaceae bacterium]|nr:phage holin family protein [Woeseiaceae bacterium]